MPDNQEVIQAISEKPPILDTIAQQQGEGLLGGCPTAVPLFTRQGHSLQI